MITIFFYFHILHFIGPIGYKGDKGDRGLIGYTGHKGEKGKYCPPKPRHLPSPRQVMEWGPKCRGRGLLSNLKLNIE